MRFDHDILVVDDEPVVLAGTRKVLEGEGFSVDEAASARGAVERLGRNNYGVVLCDLKLPQDEAPPLLDYARENFPTTPVVVITGYATLGSVIRSFGSGAFDFLPKPFDAGELLGVVGRALSAAGGWPGRTAATAGTYALGSNSWARPEPNGTATIGMGEGFDGIRDEIRTLELPEVDEEISLGTVCTRIVTGKERAHVVWAPLSGRVVETNPTRGSCSWLFRIVPSDLEGELPRLTAR